MAHIVYFVENQQDLFFDIETSRVLKILFWSGKHGGYLFVRLCLIGLNIPAKHNFVFAVDVSTRKIREWSNQYKAWVPNNQTTSMPYPPSLACYLAGSACSKSNRQSSSSKPPGYSPYLLNGSIHDVSSHQNLLLLTQSESAGNGLVFHARVPLGLDDEDAIRFCEIQPTRV